MSPIVMLPRHPYRASGQPAPSPEPRRERPGVADLDVEIVMFLVSSVVLLAGAIRGELGVVHVVALVGFLVSIREIACFLFERRGDL